jgi:penicillin-binding protein 1B
MLAGYMSWSRNDFSSDLVWYDVKSPYRGFGMRIQQWVRSQSKVTAVAWALIAIALLTPMTVPFEALVRAHLDHDMFRAPTRFYASPWLIRPGIEISRSAMEEHLERIGYRRTRSSGVELGEYRLGSREWIIGRRAFRPFGKHDVGGVVSVRLSYGGRVSRIRDADGRSLPYLAIEPELIGSHYGREREDRLPVRLSEVPQHLIDAVLTIEDQRFYQHGGLDIKRIAGATVANVKAMRLVQGGSTISQQLAKNLYLSPRRTPLRKLREAALAVALESRYSKDGILEAYLNEVYLAQDGGVAIHGVGRAAEYFFGKDVTQLDIPEAALIAGIIRGPSLYSPFRNPKQAKKRRDLVLDLMLERELISERAHARATHSPLGLKERHRDSNHGRYFVDWVAKRLERDHGDGVFEDGFTVFTTLDMELQRVAEDAVRDGLTRLERDYPRLEREDRPLQAALVAVDPRSGAVLAMVGGRDYGASQFNRAVYGRRQPGSSFKPIVALTALSQHSFTLASMLQDEPLSVETPAGMWQPANYDDRFRGPLTMREALERSLNVPFARLGMAVGPERIVETARKLGIESHLNPVPSLALGSSEVTPLELTRAFGVLAAEGFRADLQANLAVVDGAGDIVQRMEVDGEQVYDPAEAYLVTSALRGAVERGTGRSLRTWGYRGPVAAKSGTTNDFRDAWFIGYTPSLAVGVWVGFDDARSIGLSGSRAALPIFARFMVGAFGRYGEDVEFNVPRGLEIVEINRQTGLRAGPGCRGEPEVFIRGTAPTESCSPYWRSSGGIRIARSDWYDRMAPLFNELLRRAERGRR